MIILVLLVALILRLISINQSLWLDEATSMTIANQSFVDIFEFAKGDFHPPLYYMLLHVWLNIFGNSDIVGRAMSVFFGVGTVYLLYKIAGHVFNKKVGLIAAILLAVSPLHVYYSQEVRMYSLLAFFASSTIYTYLSRKWFYFSLSILLLVFSDYVGALLIPVFLIHTILLKDKHAFKHVIYSLLPLIITFSFWLPYFGEQLRGGLSVKSSSPEWWSALGGNSINQIALFGVKSITGRIDFASNLLYAFFVIVPGLIFIYFVIRGRSFLSKLSLFWLWLIIPTVLGIIISVFIPIFYYFRFLFVIPALFIIIAKSVNLSPRFEKLLLLIWIVFQLFFVGTYLFNSRFHREDWRGLVSFLNSESDSSTVVYFVANSQMEAFDYYAREFPNIVAKPPEDLGQHEGAIWIMRYVHDIFDPEEKLIKRAEDLGYKNFLEYNFNGVVIRKYEK